MLKKTNVSLLPVFLCAFASLSAFAADEAQRIATEHANDTPVASPLAEAAPAVRVDSRSVIYTQAAGQDVSGWLAWPAGKPAGRPAGRPAGEPAGAGKPVGC